jgi:signal transduction histidine kinase
VGRPGDGCRPATYSHLVVTMPLSPAEQQLDALTDLVREVSSQHDVGDVLDVALRQCLRLTGSQFGFIGLTRPAEPTGPGQPARPGQLEIVAIHGFHPAPSFYAEQRVIPLRPNLFSHVITEDRPVRTEDATAAPQRVGQPAGHPPVGTFLGVPLRLGGRPIGMIGLANRSSSYRDEHERLVLTYASLIAVLVHKAQLYEQLRRTNSSLERLVEERTQELATARDELAEKAARLQAVLADTVDAGERERRRIAVDIHDGIGQLLIGAMLELTSGEHRLAAGQPGAAADAMASARVILAEVETELRRVVHDLHPPILDGLGLPAALRDVAERFSAFSHVTCRVEIEGRPARLPPDVEIGLYRIVQEALQNVAVHAHARTVTLRLAFEREAGAATLRIDDDGCGFDVAGVASLTEGAPGDGRHHLGLESMRRRVESLAGHWQLRSDPTAGTSIRVGVPLGQAGGP